MLLAQRSRPCSCLCPLSRGFSSAKLLLAPQKGWAPPHFQALVFHPPPFLSGSLGLLLPGFKTLAQVCLLRAFCDLPDPGGLLHVPIVLCLSPGVAHHPPAHPLIMCIPAPRHYLDAKRTSVNKTQVLLSHCLVEGNAQADAWVQHLAGGSVNGEQ